eukprot:CAMPEP_0181237898 /NCGR_PEP_ID=MMETSP1096-20121128/39026_1 /TAXON_ID=156174 ORGANISM="Chrysochromulina ericina, Strain CCMP281" /NCGR_SAMPLE_ID=MMETSP1096 /ASSEMBLY_ACC=CAM_ASM_000453 /LENGTH=172 /DNA_ID=CAMNT_0023333319 /DNA_START=204 /DNA_END=718 /DNA_ORIENTATION=+
MSPSCFREPGSETNGVTSQPILTGDGEEFAQPDVIFIPPRRRAIRENGVDVKHGRSSVLVRDDAPPRLPLREKLGHAATQPSPDVVHAVRHIGGEDPVEAVTWQLTLPKPVVGALNTGATALPQERRIAFGIALQVGNHLRSASVREHDPGRAQRARVQSGDTRPSPKFKHF